MAWGTLLMAQMTQGLQQCLPTTRAGFARQGAKEKQLLKEGNAFNVSSFVLRAMMSGQYWPEGDEVYHAELTVPVLLVHGMHDKFVPVEEDQRMAEVRRGTPATNPQIPGLQLRGTRWCSPAPGMWELRSRVKSGIQKVGLPWPPLGLYTDPCI